MRRPDGGEAVKIIDFGVSKLTQLAGDYTDAEFPATLEAAVRSGRAAATGVLEARAAADVRSA